MTTREQRLREWLDTLSGRIVLANDLYSAGHSDASRKCRDELYAILAEPVEVSEEMVGRFETALYENVSRFELGNGFMTREAVRKALTYALKEPGQ